MIKLFAIILVPVLIQACEIDGPRRDTAKLKEFLREDDAGLFKDGKLIFEYSEKDCQISVNKRRKHVRLQQDNQNEYVHIQLSAFPSLPNEKIEVYIECRIDGEKMTQSYTMDAAMLGTRKIWLWDNKKHTGLIIPVCW